MPFSQRLLPRPAGPWLALWLALVWAALAAPATAGTPLGQGQPLPPLKLERPAAESQAAYLGLGPGRGRFQVSQIKRPWLLIQVFNMYCTICQGEAQRVNQLFGLLSQGPLKEQVAVIGIGAGNSPFEVKVFRDKYQVPFPLFPDRDYTIHKALGQPGTPYFLLVRLGEGKPRIVLAHLGPFGQPADFMARIQAAMKTE